MEFVCVGSVQVAWKVCVYRVQAHGESLGGRFTRLVLAWVETRKDGGCSFFDPMYMIVAQGEGPLPDAGLGGMAGEPG